MFSICRKTQRFIHSVACHHVAGNIGCLVQVVCRSSRNSVDDEYFGGTAAKQSCHLVLEFGAGHQVTVLGRALDVVAERTYSARNDRYLLYGLRTLQRQRYQRVARLVISDEFSLKRVQDATFLFQTCNDSLYCRGEIVQGDFCRRSARCYDGGFVDEIGQVGAAETGRQRGHIVKRDFPGNMNSLDVNPEYGGAPNLVGAIDENLAIESACPKQSRIKDFRSVGCREEDYSLSCIETIKFAEQLIERLLFFVVAPAQGACPTSTTEGIQFVDENNARGTGARLIKQVPDPGRANTDEHFNKLGPTDGEKRYPGFTGNRPRQECLPGTRWSHQQNTLGYVSTQSSVLFRLFEKRHYLL